ncbi:hypothetical protein [Xylophilus ampelinus]|uniref:Uncharacterized protein n=1 Tax=Xylophilus ampelinus TaxID=54067 RepID=A0A318T1X7_9BURK|nr:hypothetical protein [Xylophilus ampelinus]MCS4508925.1 hypothetical protein [Xylophilus ampelinus]PYE79491.1 hypothetical protein DFQ15_102224 [Xylophilus ampelinus]
MSGDTTEAMRAAREALAWYRDQVLAITLVVAAGDTKRAADLIRALGEDAGNRAIDGMLLLEASPAVTDSTHTGTVLEALKNYRCQHFADEDGGLPLVDAIAAALGDRSIGRAQEELELLADHLLDDARAALRQAADLLEAADDGLMGRGISADVAIAFMNAQLALQPNHESPANSKPGCTGGGG